MKTKTSDPNEWRAKYRARAQEDCIKLQEREAQQKKDAREAWEALTPMEREAAAVIRSEGFRALARAWKERDAALVRAETAEAALRARA